jgi:hypothetical protein
VTLVATPAQNYEFIGWAGAASGNSNPLTLTMNSDKQIVAQFKKLESTVQITLNPPDGGIVRPSSGIFDTGNTATFTVTPNAGYRFSSWGGDVLGSANPLNTVINSNKVIAANFIKQYTLIVNSDPNAGAVNQKGGLFDADSIVSLIATPVFPYVFTSWVGTDNNNVNPTTVTINSNKNVTCNFKKIPAPATWTEVEGPVYSGNSASVSIQLNQFEYAELEIIGGIFAANVKDPNGTIVKDFGTIQQANYIITAKVTGQYSIVMQNSNALSNTAYKIRYRIYKP